MAHTSLQPRSFIPIRLGSFEEGASGAAARAHPQRVPAPKPSRGCPKLGDFGSEPTPEIPPVPGVLTHEGAEGAESQQSLQQHPEAPQQRSAAAAVRRAGNGHGEPGCAGIRRERQGNEGE